MRQLESIFVIVAGFGKRLTAMTPRNNSVARIFLTLALFGALLLMSIGGCGPSEPRPVDIFAEDECSNCRMAISQPSFASEILTAEGDAFKFDDLQCLSMFRKKRGDVTPAAIFVKDIDSKEWMPYAQSVIVQTGMDTPMGSGMVATRTQERAKELVEQYPVAQ